MLSVNKDGSLLSVKAGSCAFDKDDLTIYVQARVTSRYKTRCGVRIEQQKNI